MSDIRKGLVCVLIASLLCVGIHQAPVLAAAVLNKANAVQLQGKPLEAPTSAEDGKSPAYSHSAGQYFHKKFKESSEFDNYSARIRQQLDAKVSKNGTGVFRHVSSVAEEGTFYIDVSNRVSYRGPRTNSIFYTLSSVYYCTNSGVCRRIDR